MNTAYAEAVGTTGGSTTPGPVPLSNLERRFSTPRVPAWPTRDVIEPMNANCTDFVATHASRCSTENLPFCRTKLGHLAARAANVPAAGGGSRRGRPRKGEVQVTVSSTTTVKAVKLQIYEKLHFSPAEQKLMYGSKELEEGDKTLGEYEVPRDADVRLHVISSDGDVDETGARIKGKGQREVDAGFSGTLLSGFGLDNSSNDNELIVVPDSLDAMQQAVQSSTGDQQVSAVTISLVEDERCVSANGHKDSEEKGRQGAPQRTSRRKKDSEEHRTILGERPTETKRQRRPPSSYDPVDPKENSQPSGVRRAGRSRGSSARASCKGGTSQEEICCVEDEDVDTQKAIAASMDTVADTDLQEALAASLAGSK